MSLSVKIPTGFNSIKTHPWVLQVTLRLPSAGTREVLKWDFRRKHRHWQKATTACTDHCWLELGFAEGHSPVLQESTGPPPCPATSPQQGVPSGMSSAPAQDRLEGNGQHNNLGACQPARCRKTCLCQLPTALLGCDLHPGRGGGGERKDTQQER